MPISDFETDHGARLRSVRRSKLEISAKSNFTFKEAVLSKPDSVILRDLKGSSVKIGSNDEVQLGEILNISRSSSVDVFVKLTDFPNSRLNDFLIEGIAGIAIQVNDVNEVINISNQILDLEYSKGIAANTFELDLTLGTTKSVVDCFEIVQASSRIASLNLDEQKLYEDLNAPFNGEEDALAFSRGRIIVAARVAEVQAHGLAFMNNQESEYSLEKQVALSRKMGFSGACCKTLEEISYLNEGFAPSLYEYERALKVKEAMEEAFEAGLGAVTLGGSEMIDVAMVRHSENTIYRHSAVKAKESRMGIDYEESDD